MSFLEMLLDLYCSTCDLLVTEGLNRTAESATHERRRRLETAVGLTTVGLGACHRPTLLLQASKQQLNHIHIREEAK